MELLLTFTLFMGIQAIHTLSGEIYFIEVPGNEMPSESINIHTCKTNGGKTFTVPQQLKSDAQYYREYLAKQQNQKD